MHNALLCPARKPAFCGKMCKYSSRENEIAERPQTLRYLEIKNIFPLIMPKAHAAGIPNRPYCSAMAFSAAFCRSVTEMVHSAFRSASVPSAESLPISTAFLPFR